MKLENENPKTIAIFNKIASIYQSTGDYNKAIQCYEKALVIEDREDCCTQ